MSEPIMNLCSCGAPGVYRGLIRAFVCPTCHDREREHVQWAGAGIELGNVVGLPAQIPSGPLCRCGEAADRRIAKVAYCRECARQLLGPIRARHGWDGVGRGRAPLFEADRQGTARVVCDECGASWRGPIGERCSYCVTALMALQDAQRAVLLRPELPHVDEPHRDAAVRAWASRLAEAVKAELVERHEAEAAIRREEGRRVAA